MSSKSFSISPGVIPTLYHLDNSWNNENVIKIILYLFG